jgi:3-oxoacyl-[acyl-carrier-protein] synthase-3
MAKIIGLGEWFPDKVRTNSAWSPELVSAFEKHLYRDLMDVVDKSESKMDPISEENFKREMLDPFVGTIERRVADDNTHSYDGEIAAAELAIQESGIDPKLIGACFSYSFFMDIPCMGAASVILKHFGADNAFGVALDGACSSGMIQLLTAKALVDSGQFKYVLITQSNFMTRGLLLPHPASPSVGDAATAILVGPDDHEGHKILNVYARSHGEHYKSVVWRRQNGDTNWLNAGEAHYLGSYNSSGARELIQRTVSMGVDTVTACCDEINLNTKDLNFFVAMHPRKWIPGAINKLIGLLDSQTVETYDKYAHLGACGALVNLLEAKKLSLLNKGDKVGIYTQGAGFTRAAAVIEW